MKDVGAAVVDEGVGTDVMEGEDIWSQCQHDEVVVGNSYQQQVDDEMVVIDKLMMLNGGADIGMVFDSLLQLHHSAQRKGEDYCYTQMDVVGDAIVHLEVMMGGSHLHQKRPI